MAGIRKAAAWLGLVPDDRYGHDPVDEEYTEQVFEDEEVSAVTPIHRSSEPVEQPAPAPVRRRTHEPAQEESPSVPENHPSARPVAKATADLSRIITVHPRTYNEARTIGEHYRDGVPVIMNLSEMDDADAKRLVDFAAGLIFGLRGTIERVTNKVFLLSPPNVNVTAEDKQRIASGGFFNQS
ncbi:cell division protein SepF [Propionibacteriaceae bacterium Y1923]|uniref:cell division protein SepF n=1 Tax=Aestuariimicrobium sp. Y1814 TaxID=3418742 RepID=UPI003C24ACB8